MYDELMDLEQDLQRQSFELDALTTAMREVETQGVSRELVMSLESHCPELVSDTTPLASYTAYPSATNVSVAMEGIKDRMLRGLVKGIIAAIRFYYKVTAWIIEKVANLAFNSLVNKLTGQHTSFWDDVRTAFLSEDKRRVAEAYRDKSKMLACVYIEDHADDLPDDEAFYHMLNEHAEPTTETLDLLTETLEEVFEALDANDPERLGKAKAHLEQNAPNRLARLWDSPLIRYTQSIDEYLESTPISPDTATARRQAKHPPSLSEPEMPVIPQVIKERREILTYMRNEKRAGLPKMKSIDKLIGSGILEVKRADKAQQQFTENAVATSERLDKLLSQVERIEMPRASDVSSHDLYTVSNLTQRVITTVARFGAAQQSSTMIQGDLNRVKVRMVDAFKSAMELEERLKAKAKADKEERERYG